MKREMEPYQLIERSIIKKYRKELWTPFIVAVKRYELIKAGESYMKSAGIIWPLFYTGLFYLVFVGILTIVFNLIERKLSYFK